MNNAKGRISVHRERQAPKINRTVNRPQRPAPTPNRAKSPTSQSSEGERKMSGISDDSKAEFKDHTSASQGNRAKMPSRANRVAPKFRNQNKKTLGSKSSKPKKKEMVLPEKMNDDAKAAQSRKFVSQKMVKDATKIKENAKEKADKVKVQEDKKQKIRRLALDARTRLSPCIEGKGSKISKIRRLAANCAVLKESDIKENIPETKLYHILHRNLNPRKEDDDITRAEKEAVSCLLNMIEDS